MKKRQRHTAPVDPARRNEGLTERIQVRCTPTEKKYWIEVLSGDLSATVRELLPTVPVR